jgi:predicted dehydrogenase
MKVIFVTNRKLMEGKMLRWGILGCGKIAHKFASDMHFAEGSVVTCCASRDEEKSKQFAHKYGISNAYFTYERMLEDTPCDIVYVATPHSHHEQHVLQCLEAGKHVLCEKPMGVNAGQVKRMQQKAKEKGLFLMEAMWTGVLPIMKDIRAVIASGGIGEVRRISADFGFSFPFDAQSRVYNPILAGGTLLDIGIYPLYVAMSILGVPQEIQSFVTKASTGTDSECSIHLHYANGATASLYSAVTCTTPTECTIVGTEGTIRIPSRFHEQSKYLLETKDGVVHERQAGKKGYGYVHEIDHVRECLIHGYTESPVLTFNLTHQLTQIMDQIRKQHGIQYPFEITERQV